MLIIESRKINVYPKEYQWLEKQKHKWANKAYGYFCSIADKHNYDELVEEWKNKAIESAEFCRKWLLNQPMLCFYPEDKDISFYMMHKPLDFGIEALKVVIDRYWEILKA